MLLFFNSSSFANAIETIKKEVQESKCNNEWKSVETREELKQKLRKLLDDNKSLWFAVCVFNQRNLKVLDNSRDIAYTDLSKPSNTRNQNRVAGFQN